MFGSQGVRHLFFTAERFAAARAYEIGALDQCASGAEADAAAERMAQRMAENAPLTLRAAKLAIRATEGAGQNVLAEARRATTAANASGDYREGRLAFAEKRAPRFTGT